MTKILVIILALLAWPAAAETLPEYSDTPYIETLLGFALPEDRAALETFEDDTRTMLEAMAAREDVDAASRQTATDMLAMLDAERLPFIRTDLPGNWRFRSYQVDPLGGFTYGAFPGRFYPEGLAMVLDKSGGSQRHFGMMAGEAGDLAELRYMIYLGAESYDTDPRPRLYSTMESATDAESRTRDETGILLRIGADRFILVFTPRDGRAEIIEITRA